MPEMPFTSTRCACCSGSTAKRWSPWLARPEPAPDSMRLMRSWFSSLASMHPRRVLVAGPDEHAGGRRGWATPIGCAHRRSKAAICAAGGAPARHGAHADNGADQRGAPRRLSVAAPRDVGGDDRSPHTVSLAWLPRGCALPADGKRRRSNDQHGAGTLTSIGFTRLLPWLNRSTTMPISRCAVPGQSPHIPGASRRRRSRRSGPAACR